MSKEYIIFVIDDQINSGTQTEMQSIDLFNAELRANNQWIFAGGISDARSSELIDNRAGANESRATSLIKSLENYSGFWLIRAANSEVARELAFAGSLACNRKVELRPLLG